MKFFEYKCPICIAEIHVFCYMVLVSKSLKKLCQIWTLKHSFHFYSAKNVYFQLKKLKYIVKPIIDCS